MSEQQFWVDRFLSRCGAGVVCCMCVLMVTACTSDTSDVTVTTVPPEVDTSAIVVPSEGAWGTPVVVGETPGYVPPDGLRPYVAVAVGSDDLPVVVFFNQSTDVVEFRRCIDDGCVEPPISGQFEVPSDLYLEWLTLELGPSDLPVLTLEGSPINDEGNGTALLVYLASCVDAACSEQSWTRFADEMHPHIGFRDDGALVMTSAAETPFEDPAAERDMRLVIRTCSDLNCKQELSHVEIPVLPIFQYWDLLLDAEGIPAAVSGVGDSEDGGGVIVVASCSDATCSSHEMTFTETEHDTYEFTAAFGEKPVVAYGTGSGVFTVTWNSGLDEACTTVAVDDTRSDAHAFSEMTSLGYGSAPVVAYVRMLNIETDEETRQLLVAECAEPNCSAGTRTVVARGTDETGLETNPAVAIAPNGDTVIAFHICPPGCAPQYINVLRCEGSCATAFPDQIEATW